MLARACSLGSLSGQTARERPSGTLDINNEHKRENLEERVRIGRGGEGMFTSKMRLKPRQLLDHMFALDFGDMMRSRCQK